MYIRKAAQLPGVDGCFVEIFAPCAAPPAPTVPESSGGLPRVTPSKKNEYVTPW